MSAKQLPIVIITRNSLPLTKLAVKSALAQDIPVTVLVLDNDSSDGTRDWMRSKNGIVTCFTPEQWSLARCWNWALRALWRSGCERALVLNNDVEILPCCARYLHAMQREFVTGVSVSEAVQLEGAPGLEWSYHTREHPDFSCFMISKECVEKVGWFDELMFPAYCEDSDYHVRMHRKGIRAICVDVPFLHHGASTLKNASIGEQAAIRRGADKNRKRFYAKYNCFPGTPEYEGLFNEKNGN